MYISTLQKTLFFPPASPVMVLEVGDICGDIRPHSHDFLEIAIILSGQARYQTYDDDQVIEAGDLFVLHEGAWHAYVDCRSLTVLNVGIDRTFLHRHMLWVLDNPAIQCLLTTEASGGTSYYQRYSPQAIAGFRKTMTQLYFALNNDANDLEVLGHFMVFLGQLAATTPVKIANRHLHPELIRVIEAINANLSNKWTLEECAKLACMSPSHLARLCRLQLKSSLVEYITQRRIEKATTLLTHTNMSIARIGATVGWVDQNYFARRFKQKVGMPPSEFRTQNRVS